MIILGFWKNIGSLYILYVYRWFCISDMTTMQSLCCRIFVKSKGVILIEMCKFFLSTFPKAVLAVLTA